MVEGNFEIGLVGRIFVRHHYGFVHTPDGRRFFLHESAMKSGRLPPSGTRVRFLRAPGRQGEKSERAVNVEVV